MQRKDERFTQPVEGYLNIDVPVHGERFPCVLLQRAQDWRCTGDKGKDRWAVLSQQPGGYGGVTGICSHELQPRVASGEFGQRARIARDGDHRRTLSQECLRHAPPKSTACAGHNRARVNELVHPYLLSSTMTLEADTLPCLSGKGVTK